MIENILERLAEMFPSQHYQNQLDRYLSNKQVKTGSDIEFWTREYERTHNGY